MSSLDLCSHGILRKLTCLDCNRFVGELAREQQAERRTPTPANATQVGGTHYKAMKIQTWDFINANDIPYMEGNIIKYVARWKSKGGVEDLHKALHYIEKLIEDNLNKEASK